MDQADGLTPVSLHDGEIIARAAYGAVHGRGAFDDLDILDRDAASIEAQDAANKAGLGSVPW